MSQEPVPDHVYDTVEAALHHSIADTAQRIGIEPQILADEIDRALQAEIVARGLRGEDSDGEDLVEQAWRNTLARHAPNLPPQTVRDLIEDVIQNVYRAVVDLQLTLH